MINVAKQLKSFYKNNQILMHMSTLNYLNKGTFYLSGVLEIHIYLHIVHASLMLSVEYADWHIFHTVPQDLHTFCKSELL